MRFFITPKSPDFSGLLSMLKALLHWLKGHKKLSMQGLNQMNFALINAQGYAAEKIYQQHGQDKVYLMSKDNNKIALFYPTDDQQNLVETLKLAKTLLDENQAHLLLIPIAEMKNRAHFTLLTVSSSEINFIDPKTEKTFYNKQFGTYDISHIRKACEQYLKMRPTFVYRGDQVFRTSTCGWHTASYVKSTIDPKISGKNRHKTKFKELYDTLDKNKLIEKSHDTAEIITCNERLSSTDSLEF